VEVLIDLLQIKSLRIRGYLSGSIHAVDDLSYEVEEARIVMLSGLDSGIVRNLDLTIETDPKLLE
jgi:hypothetical protein